MDFHKSSCAGGKVFDRKFGKIFDIGKEFSDELFFFQIANDVRDAGNCGDLFFFALDLLKGVC